MFSFNNQKENNFMDRFYETALPRNGNRENELIAKFYKPMVAYVINRMELLTSESNHDEMSPETIDERYGLVRVTYESGNVFEGQISEWMPHGTGHLYLNENGIIYEGQFKDGLPGGNGLVKWPDDSWYEGEFCNGLRHGRGLHVSAEDGRRYYAGQWTAGRRNGFGQTGCCDQSDGALNYVGDWLDGRPHGRGTGSWPDETRYTGQWSNGRPHGHGKAWWPGNDMYEGDWVDGLMDGTGTYEWNSNPRDCDQLVLCMCNKYTGQWSKSKKHGPGVYFSMDNGSTVHGRWSNDVLDGPCDIVLSTGLRPSSTGLEFHSNVLYGPAPPLPSPPITSQVNRGRRLPFSTTRGHGNRRLPAPAVVSERQLPPVILSKSSSSLFRIPCKPRLPVINGNDVHSASRKNPDPQSVRVHIPLSMTDMHTAYNLTGHVQKMAAKYSEISLKPALDVQLELRTVECTLKVYADRLAWMYRAYGTFLADGPVTYQPLMIRLGLWQLLIDNQLHARLSLADFDELLYETRDYAFKTAHDPFEPIYFWQFVHAMCDLAIVIYDTRRIRREDTYPIGNCGMMASTLLRLFTEHLKPDVVPASYAVTGCGELWMNSRKTVERMYDVYQTMTVADGSLPTARLLIRLYGPKLGDEPSLTLNSALPHVLDAMLGVGYEQTDYATAGCTGSGQMTVFEFSVRSVIALLSEACPRIVDGRGVLVDVETRLTFAEWFRFMLLCVREFRKIPKLDGTESLLQNESAESPLQSPVV